jgi:chromosome segregation protein
LKFQSVRISGFKSFLEPIEIEINKGLTGIVGPNGCGKSNIVEAIKWIMGENSARQMRGDGMDDVIFAGTDERPSRNFAEVTIKLNNSEKKAPAAFNHLSEIEISRKIEREKGSIYRINGKQVRSRDVQLIFADSGTGARSSGIVSQGRIAQIIDASPENRRGILEEAANIKGLHSRRHEAELKLNAASNNLDRLLDIEKTYKEQLVELEKQGRKAARYRSIGDRLRKAEATLFSTLLFNAKKEYNILKNELHTVTENVSKAQIEVSKNTTSKLDILSKIPILRNIEAEKAAILQSLNITKIKLEEEQTSAKIALNNIISQITQLEKDTSRENQIEEDAEKSLSSLILEEENLKIDTKNFSSKISEATQAVKSLKIKSDEADKKLSSITSEIYTINSDKSDLERRIINLNEKIENTQNQISKFNLENYSKTLEANEIKILDLQKLISKNHLLIDTFKKKLTQLETLELSLTKEKNIAANILNQTNAEINTLSSLLGDDSLNRNTLEKNINTTDHLEDAIGSVLGETLLAPIYSNNEIIENTTYWRDGFDIKLTSPLPKEAIPLISKIKSSSILETALQGIGIVKNEELAFKLQKILTYGQALTTAEGGLWRWDGFVQPKGVKNSYSERLQQIARFKVLQSQLPSQKESVFLIDKKLIEYSENIKKCRTDIIKLQSTLSGLNSDSNRLELENSKIEIQLASSALLMKELKNTEVTSKVELIELKKQISHIVNLPSLLADELSIRNNAEQFRNNLTEAMAAEQQIKNHESFQLRNIAQIKHQKESWITRKQEAKSRLSSLHERLEFSKNEMDRLSNLPNDFDKKEEQIRIEIEAAIINRNLAADKLVITETSQNDAEKLEKESEKNVSILRENMIKVQALLDLAHTKIFNIEERIFEKLRIKSDQLSDLTGIKENNEIDSNIEALEKTVERLLNERESLGAVNLRAEEEMNEMNDKIEIMFKERIDLEEAIEKLRNGIFELNKEGRERLKKSFTVVNENFKNLFQKLFGGGNAELKLVGHDDPLQAGLEVLASPPGKKMQLLSLLSGGEQALTAISLIFSVFLCNPSPICILDEVDAPLDDTNVGRFCDLLNKIAEETNTYFMVITHHRLTMAKMDRLFGVTMEQKGISKLVSVDLEQASRIRDIA